MGWENTTDRFSFHRLLFDFLVLLLDSFVFARNCFCANCLGSVAKELDPELRRLFDLGWIRK